jgi:ABC-2 type transport system permease protein
MKIEDFAGTGRLARLIVQRDRLLLLAWVLVLTLIAAMIAVSFAKLYPTPESLIAFADEANAIPAEVALLGKVLSPTLGGAVGWRWTMPAFIIGGLASLLAAIRYTRTEEETGRRELVSSTAVGMYAELSAGLAVVFAANLVIAALISIMLIGFGLPAVGSFALALSTAASGCLFAGVGCAAAQIAESTGMARGIAGGLLGLAFLVRAMGDGGDKPWLSWLSPNGWMQHVRPFAGEQCWVFLLFIGAIVVLSAAAFVLSSRRDLGAGLLPQRPGPAAASRWLNSPLALAWRLQRGMLFMWILVYAVIGAAFGYMGKAITDQLSANPQVMELLSRLGGNTTPADGLFVMVLLLMGEVMTVYAIMAALKLQSEENEMHAEAVLATPVSRLRWASGHLAIAIAGTAVVLLTFGLAAGLTYGLSMGEGVNEVANMLAAAIVYLPAIWVLGGIAVALYGLLPRLTLASWGAFIACLLIELAVELQQVSGAVQDLSPFTHVPKLLVSDASLVPVIGLAILALALVGIGLAGLQRRSLG